MAERLWRRNPEGEPERRQPEGGEPGAALPPARPSLWRAFVAGLRLAYDRLGTTVAGSVLWVVAFVTLSAGAAQVARSLEPAWSAAPLALLVVEPALLALVLGPLTAGLYRHARNAAAFNEPELLDLTWGFRSALGRSIALALAQNALVVILIGDCVFLVTRQSALLMGAGILFGYLALFWLAASLYQWPLLCESGDSPLKVIRKSLLLCLDNAGFSVGLGGLCLLLTLACWIFVPALAIWAGLAAAVQTQATRALLRRYGVLPPEPDAAAEAEEGWGHGWHE